MKTVRYIFLTMFVAMAAMSMKAQQRNVLLVPDMRTQTGNVQLPIAIENTDEIVGAQFDITLPSGITANTIGTMSNRSDGHSVTVTKVSSGAYRVLLHSTQNRPLRGQSGVVMYLPISIPSSFQEGSEYPITIEKAVLGKSTGENVLTNVSAGKIYILKLPDLTVKSITCDKQTFAPDDHIVVSWQVQNVGELATGAGWGEQISLVSEDGSQSKPLSTTHYDEILSPSGVVSRQAEIAIPAVLGMDGQARLQVRIVPDSKTGEPASAQGNNTQQGNNLLTINKVLTFDLSPTRVDENRNTRVSLKVTRSGRCSAAQTFPITATSDSRVPVPAEITIPANQARETVYFNIVDNEVLDNDSIVNISVGGNGYSAVQQTLMVIDDEFPDLNVTASRTDVTEGESFQLTISTMRISAYPITVSIASENNKRFSFPATAIIPAGQESVTIGVEAVEDDIPSLNFSNAFTVSAPRHNKAEAIVLLLDNDLPALELSITPTTVSESVGAVAIEGTLRRTTNIDKKIMVKLTDDADGGLYFGNRTFELASGVEEVHFNFGPVDNAIVDGDRTYNITAAVWISSCNCGASGESAGFSTAQLQVLDNDGAALNMSASVSTVKEGSTTTLTISRNTSTNSPLTVTLTSDYTEGLTYPQSVTIPAGQLSTTVDVVSTGNDVQGDSHNVIFTVKANGYATGTCFLTITDQTKPDAIISALRVDSYEIEVGQSVSLSVVVTNKGIAVLPYGTEVKISCSGSSEQKTLTLPVDLAAGDSVTLETEYILPITATGNYTLTATVNPGRYVSELNYNNNALSSAPITLQPNFSATVTVDKSIYRQGETVMISGQTSAGGRNSDVEVYLISNGARQSLTVKADDKGHFETTYQPYDRQAGHFVAGACYPKTGESSGSAEFDVYGLLLSDVYATHDISLGDEASGSFTIKNPGLLRQTGLQIEQLNEPNGCELTIGEVSAIDADGQVEVPYSLTANAVSPGSDWLQVPLRITSSEGSTSTFTIYYYVRSLKAQLKANQTRIETTMTKGVARDYLLQVSNVGRGETGRISLSLPSWIELATASEIPSLNQGDTITLALHMLSTDDMQMNVPITGQIGINCEKGDGVAVGLSVTPVSEETGNLVLDVVDEYSFYAEGSPHVEGAKVLVKHPTTGQVVAQGQTASNGYYSVELPEGWYTVSINADKHQGYQTTLEVAPGKNTAKQIFLTYDAISYSWEVVETEVEDVYQIETVVKFETNVPKPVIVSTLPSEKPEIGGIVPVVITNKGLIAANDVDLSLSASDGFELEWLTNPSMSVLAPQQSAVFYAVLKEKAAQSIRKRAPGENYATCMNLFLDIRGKYFCGDYEEAIRETNSRAWGDCLESHFYTGGTSGGSGGWGGGGSYSGNAPHSSPGGTNNSYVSSSWQGTPSPTARMCHEKDEVLLTNLAKVKEPERTDDCAKTEIGGYVLVPYDGPEYDIRGVAADGESKVFIKFSGEEGVKNVIPFDPTCGYPHWSIKEGIGTLENDDCWYNVIYKAPDDFPVDSTGSEITVHAVLEYTTMALNEAGETVATFKTHEVPIVVTRAPLALIHGLASSPGTWKNFAEYITENTGGGASWAPHEDKIVPMYNSRYENNILYKRYQVLCVDYTNTHTEWFSANEKVVEQAIETLIDEYIKHGIVATKADLIGHSMGGILARLHVQYVDNTNVHKLITVNTPHSGSPVANVVNDLPFKYRMLLYPIFLGDHLISKTRKISSGALKDLAVGSKGIDEYLNRSDEYLNKMNNIPIHAVASYMSGFTLDAFYALVSSIGYVKDVYEVYKGSKFKDWDNVLDAILSEPHDKNLLQSIVDGFKFVKSFGKTVLSAKNIVELPADLPEDLSYGLNLADALTPSDCIVPYDSQTGGLSERYVTPLDGGLEYMHMCMTGNSDVWQHLKDLLIASTDDDNYFCKTGFHPTKIELDLEGKKDTSKAEKPRRIRKETSKDLSLSIVDDSLCVVVSGFDSPAIFIQFSDDYDIALENEFKLPIPSTHSGDIWIYSYFEDDNGDVCCDSAFVNVPSPRTMPTDITCNQICKIPINSPFDVSLTCTWADGSVTTVIPEAASFTDGLASYFDGKITGLKSGSGTATFTYRGLTCEVPITVYNFGNSDDKEKSKSVCSTITLKLSQTMTMTRQAFRGTLTVFNGNESASMRDVKLTLQVTNKETGKVATSHEFQMNAESLEGFTGEVDLTSGWALAGNATGTATILFIPTKYAAPTEPAEWSFGGTLSYLDPYTGLTVTRDLYPVTLTVKPSPELDLTYFMQRDVYGDDPLTMDVVEPVKPAEFALLINNKGYGDATDVRMVTQQPEIVDNQKGLHINFELISSQVNGAPATLSFGQTITNNFGTIPAHSQMYAQWWLTSSLLGHFTDYDVQATHVTSYGNEDLSLLDQVTIHELIHGFDLSTDEQQLRAFLVNDLPDIEDQPDMLYFSDGETADVSIAASSAVEKTSSTTCTLTIVPSATGWNYGNLLDPTHGMATIKSIVRQSDGKEIAADNFWQTDRTLRDGSDPLYENRLHFIDDFTSQSAETYIITFDPVPDVLLEVESIAVVPDEDTVAEEPVDQLTVTFSKPIDPLTFTGDDIAFVVQGTKQDASQIGVTTDNNQSFVLDLKTLTEQCPNGYYTLTVQTADITDNEGYQGKTGKQVGWVMYRGGLVQLLTSVYPLESGSVQRSESAGVKARRAPAVSGTAAYGSDVTLTATPAEGFEFLNWTLNGEVVSTDPEFTAQAIGDMDVVANFTKKSYLVEVASENGMISGTATGYYQHGDLLTLTAKPDADYVFTGWMVNGVAAGTNPTLTLTLDKALDIKANFVRDIYHQKLSLNRGWNWVSSYLREPQAVDVLTNSSSRVLAQFDELIRDPEYGMVGGITAFEPAVAYKVNASSAYIHILNGHLYDLAVSPMTVKRGWNWIAYPYWQTKSVDDVLINSEEGDYITAQTGFAEYADGCWQGSLTTLEPGAGYMYKSASDKTLAFDFEEKDEAGVKGFKHSNMELAPVASPTANVDIHQYPNTMNITATLTRNGETMDGTALIYAFAGDELRGVSRYVGSNYYLTVYGEQPVEITFIIEDTTTGELATANETLTFRNDVVGSRKSPYAFTMGEATGIDAIGLDAGPMTVYGVDGRLISNDANLQSLRRLPKGIYIVNGHKCYVK